MYSVSEIHKLIELSELIRQKGQKYPKKRLIFSDLIDDGTPTIIGISGLRGIGKTVILTQLLNTLQNSLYISLDSTHVTDLFELTKILSKQYKILFTLPFRSCIANLPQNTLLGSIKEDFFANVMRNNKINIFYLKNRRGRKLPDFMIEVKNKKYIIEIGGKSKGFAQFKGIPDKYHKIITTYPYANKEHSIPLFYFGLLN